MDSCVSGSTIFQQEGSAAPTLCRPQNDGKHLLFLRRVLISGRMVLAMSSAPQPPQWWQSPKPTHWEVVNEVGKHLLLQSSSLAPQ